MKSALPPFDRARVLVAGDVMLDRYYHGATSRISPEAPVPVVRVESREERPGGAANVALNIAALGGSVELVGLTGRDEAAEVLGRRLESAGVRCAFRVVEGAPTITKLRVLSRHQQLIRLDFEDAFHDGDESSLIEPFSTGLERCDVVLLSDYAKGALRDAPRLIELARAAGRPVLVDPKGRDFGRYRGASLITPNLGEFEAVVGHCRDDEALVERGSELLERFELEGVLVTRGEHGMSLFRRDCDVLHLPTRAREVYDVTGAGDTVISVLAAALAAGDDWPEATILANLAAGLVVGKVGTATVTAAELRRALHEEHDDARGVVGEDRLVEAVADARAHGERVVMTNGCFDLLHHGHVTYLEEARRLGDRLVVAVNDDDSVRRLKGEERPINPIEQRMALLAALECVDWVVPFAEDTPERLYCRVLPDVLVKGGDYRPDEVAGAKCVKAHGGEVAILGFVDGLSTTGLIERLRGGR
ncbi:bifunctional D-glycero-beta-D-manno-heptose-7-phosphate kinase/D-glycero-beta-D-manno-heptose 1-phosphate adenylyltransferase HldE [Endothiovibrio diazotrophicus]